MSSSDLYELSEKAEYKPITFGLFNRIDDDMIPHLWGKQNNTVYGIDDFIYAELELTSKESFLLKMHNKDFLRRVSNLKKKFEGEMVIVDVDFNEGKINIIRLI